MQASHHHFHCLVYEMVFSMDISVRTSRVIEQRQLATSSHQHLSYDLTI
uniref:Uncharacterized protein n=1 Tax=Arundo donax TaxID=35708 RepID=A0A0A8ZUA6_ARUDO